MTTKTLASPVPRKRFNYTETEKKSMPNDAITPFTLRSRRRTSSTATTGAAARRC